jgi:two-component system sensor histidine kinase/response regulator
MDDYMAKPIALKELEEKITRWSEQARLALSQRAEDRGQESPETPESELSTGAAVLDVSVLRGLVGDKDELVERLLRSFRESALKAHRDLREAFEAQDIGRIAMVAHTIKSSARSVGALPLGTLCASLEESGREGDLDGIAVSMTQLDPSMQAVQAALEQELASLGESATEVSKATA